jgi:acyl carrier protein
VSPAKIRESLRSILVMELQVSPEDITPDADLVTDLEADSLAKTGIIKTIEDDFGIEISDLEADDLNTVADLADLIETKLSA